MRAMVIDYGRKGLAALAMALALVLFAMVGAAAPARAQGLSAMAVLSGANVVPPVETEASGTATARLEGFAVAYTLQALNIEGATEAHVHLGGPGESGEIVAVLFGPVAAGVDGIEVSGTLTIGDLLGPSAGDPLGFLAALQDGNAYVDVHTLAYPQGEIRGQIERAQAAEEVEAPEAPEAPEALAGPAVPAVPDQGQEPAMAPGAGEAEGADGDAVAALPSTGSGGLADPSHDGGGGWRWALLAAGSVVAIVVGGRLLQRRF